MEVIKIDQLLNLFGSEDLVNKYLGLFIVETPKTIGEINESFKSGDLNQVSILAHGLKSQFRYIGSDKLAILCQTIEEQSLQNEPIISIKQLIAELEEKTALLIQSIAIAKDL